jgi:hypothetical protein
MTDLSAANSASVDAIGLRFLNANRRIFS